MVLIWHWTAEYEPLNNCFHTWKGILDKNVIGSKQKVHHIEFACILSQRTQYAAMSYSVMLYNRKAVILYSVTSYRNQNSIVSYLVAIDCNWYAVVSYSVTWYPNLNYVVSYPVNLYCNLNDVVLYPITIDGIQEIVMLHTATVYYSQDAVTLYPIVSRCRFLSRRTRWKCGQQPSKLDR